MTQKQHVIHGRDHLPTGADPIPGLGEGGGGQPVILDYFDNSSGSVHMAPNTAAHDGTTQSQNWVVWSEQANWSGYDEPEPWIAVDDQTTGTDTYGDTILRRWVCLPHQGHRLRPGRTSHRHCARPGHLLNGLVRDALPGQWWQEILSPSGIYAPEFPDGSAWDDGEIGDPIFGNYGWRSDFPVCTDSTVDSTISSYRRRPSLTFYQQTGGAVFGVVGFKVTQRELSPRWQRRLRGLPVLFS